MGFTEPARGIHPDLTDNPGIVVNHTGIVAVYTQRGPCQEKKQLGKMNLQCLLP